MWEIYDHLIEGIPNDIYAEDVCLGVSLAYVKSIGIGVSFRPSNCIQSPRSAGIMHNMKVKKLSEYVKSWNFNEAALGLAAINSYYNNDALIANTFNEENNYVGAQLETEYFKQLFKGKKVAFVGHLHFTEEFKHICQLTVLEREQREGDLPDPACEYVLSNQDYVVISATSFINKSLPRLLRLCKSSFVILIGPSLPMAKCLFEFNINVLCGRLIFDPDNNTEILSWIKEGGRVGLKNHKSVQIRKKTLDVRR